MPFSAWRRTGRFMSVADVDALIHPDDGNLPNRHSNARHFQNTLRRSHCFESAMRRATGFGSRARVEKIDDESGGASHLVGIALDITEQKALAERSAQADMRLRDAIEAISEAFVLWDAENRLVLCNSKFQRFHNLAKATIASGTSYAQIMADGTSPMIQTHIPLDETPQIGARTYEARFADGRWLQINERPHERRRLCFVWARTSPP